MAHLPSGSLSGFFPTEVLGHLRPPAQIMQWNVAAPNPSGLRHVESGAIRRVAHLGNRGGFTAQQESGVVIDFGRVNVEDGDAFETQTVALTFSFGDLNSNVDSRFDRLFNRGSGEGETNLVGFNFRFWEGNLSAFDTVALSGGLPVSGVRPTFFFRESAEWRQRFDLTQTEPSGLTSSGTFPSGAPLIPVSGVFELPASFPDCPNIHSRENDTTISGSFLDREMTNFIYVKAFFPQLPSGQSYKLGTYGGLGLETFRLNFSYDYTAFGSNIQDPEDIKDFPIFIAQELPDAGILGTESGWWQMNENSPRLSRVSGFPGADMTLVEFVEGGGTVGRASGIVSSGSASGFAAFLRSNRRDFLEMFSPGLGVNATDFGSDQNDGAQSFTITGWIALNDPSGVDPAATGVGARPPWLHTGVISRWNFRFAQQGLQYRLYYHNGLDRFIWQIHNQRFTFPFIPYSFMNVDSQDNGFGAGGGQTTFTKFGSAAGGGGTVPEKWYFFVFGYDRDADPKNGSSAGNIFLRINDGPIDRIGLGAGTDRFGFANVSAGLSNPPFSTAGFTRSAGNGQIGPGAGRYDNVTLHRGVVLTNKQQLIMYNRGFGQEFPIGQKQIIDFSLSPEETLFETDPDPQPLRRGLRGWYNFSDASGVTRAADSNRYYDLTQPPNEVIASGAPSGFIPTSGIVVNEMPIFAGLGDASGALQIRKDGGVGFNDGQAGNGLWWQANSDQVGLFGYMSWTIAVWCRFPTKATLDVVACVWTDAGNNRHWRIRKDGGGNFRFDRANGTTIGKPVELVVGNGGSFVADRWYLVTVTNEHTGVGSNSVKMSVLDSVTGQSFSNSAVDTFQWNQFFPPGAVPFTIGAQETLGTPQVADVDVAGFGVWYRKLSDIEIAILFNSGKGLNFGAPNFTKVSRVYWDSDLTRAGDPSTK